MRPRIALTALALFLLPTAACADTIPFNTPTFTLPAQAGQKDVNSKIYYLSPSSLSKIFIDSL